MSEEEGINAGHTPGPWSIRRVVNQADAPGTTIVIVPEIEGGSPASPFFCITSEAFCWEDREADARLIAAAPDLLAACRTMLAKCRAEAIADDPDWSDDWNALAEQIGSAIDKAEASPSTESPTHA